MTRLLPFTFVYFLIAIRFAYAQPDSLWTRSYDVGINDFARAVVITNDNSILLAGFTTDPARGDSGNGWLLKLDGFGDSLWYRELPEFARINAMITTPGGYAVCGRNEEFEAVVARLDSEGNMIWSEVRSAQAEFNHLCMTQSGGFACCGYRWVDSAPRQDAWIVKFESDGDFDWQRQTSSSGWDLAEKIIETTDEDLVIAGTTVQTPNEALLISRTENGGFQWSEGFASGENTFIRGTHLIADSADGCFMATTHEHGDGDMSFRLERLMPNSIPIWTVTQYEPDTRFDLREFLQLPDGDFITCGMIEDSVKSVFIERRHNGDIPKWSRRFQNEDVQIYSAVTVSDSGLVIVGAEFSEHGNANVFVMRVDPLVLQTVNDLVIYRVGATTDVHLAWSALPGAISYNIYRSTESEFEPEEGIYIGNMTSTQFDDFNALNITSEKHFYIVTALSENNQ